ncbi:MAG: archaeal heat shock protein Hsp20 [Candidatus Thermoplasmatota archaeon]
MAPPEDPFDAWRKRATGDFPEFFHEFEKEFARMQGMVNKMMEDAMKHAQSPQRAEPFVYGFSMRVGPDGTPHLQPFGSAAKDVPEVGLEAGSREPMSDVLEGDQDVSITVELPGVEKADVNLHVGDENVTVRVEKGRRYHKHISLPAKVVPSTAKATFKNGILDVSVQKAHGGGSDHKVSIE